MRISIAMCTCDGEMYLPEQLASFICQTRLPDELVICDDGSTDRTKDIIEDFARTAPFAVRIFHNASVLGVTENFEKAVRLCEGDLLFFSDQDDAWLPSRLETVEGIMRSNPDVGAALCDSMIVDEHMQPIGRTIWGEGRIKERLRQRVVNGESQQAVLKTNCIYGHAMAFRSVYRDCILPFPTTAKCGYDEWAFTLIGLLSSVFFVPEALVKYRRHDQNQTPMNFVTPSTRVAYATLRTPLSSRKRQFSKRVITFQHLRERLCSIMQDNPRQYPVESAIKLLDSCIAHYQRRANMPSARLKRIPYVLNEAARLGYHHYSRGVYDLAKDLLQRDKIS